MPEYVRVGVVGTSPQARWHLANLDSHPRARLAAACGRLRDGVEAVAAQFKVPQVFTDYHAMIETGELDALVVVTPDDLHYPIVMDALDRGLHVLLVLLI